MKCKRLAVESYMLIISEIFSHCKFTKKVSTKYVRANSFMQMMLDEYHRSNNLYEAFTVFQETFMSNIQLLISSLRMGISWKII